MITGTVRRERAKQRSARRATSKAAHIAPRDLLREAFEGAAARPSRLLITIVGTVLGIASLTATVGFAQTAGGQIAQQFDAVAATRVTVEAATSRDARGTERAVLTLPRDAVARVTELAGVEYAALYAKLSGTIEITAIQVQDPSAAATAAPALIAASAQLLPVVDGRIGSGRFFDAGHEQRGDRVVVLGRKAAEKLGINRVSGGPAIFIDDHAYTVIGILDDVATRQPLLDAVIVPITTAWAELGLAAADSLDMRIAIGAGPVVARQAPIALNPNDPSGYRISAPPDTSELQRSVQADINLLFLAIGVVALLGGGIGIANVTLLSVTERRGEIGLRRALGARARDIANQFMIESLTTGILGGLIGVACGLFALIAVCLVQQWTPVMAWWVAPLGVAVGAVVGLAAGGYPARTAARIEPVDALRDR